jgi:hypothetical protein
MELVSSPGFRDWSNVWGSAAAGHAEVTRAVINAAIVQFRLRMRVLRPGLYRKPRRDAVGLL